MDEIEKIQKENEKYLELFKDWLGDKKLKESTIRKHLKKVDFYINEYLMNGMPSVMQRGCGFEISCFIKDLNRKTVWPSESENREFCASIKKFYKCMLENGFVDKNDYDDLCWCIRELKDEWIEDLYHVNPKLIYVQDIVEALESVDDFCDVFLDVETAKIIRMPNDEAFLCDEDLDLLDQIYYRDSKYVALPDQRDLHEYDIMTEFAEKADSNKRVILIDALNRRRPFRSFKDKIIELGIDDMYYRFRREKFRNVAISFLEDHKIEYSLEDKTNGVECR